MDESDREEATRLGGLVAFLYGYIRSAKRAGHILPTVADHLLRKIEKEHPRAKEWRSEEVA